MSKKEEVVAKEETKPEASNAIAEAVKQAISEALPLAAAIAAQATANAQTARAAPVTGQSLKNAPKCFECGQPNMACKGKHRMACVWPDDPEAAEWFTGVKINTARYISNGPGHFITVPADSDIEYTMAQWVHNERVQRRGRKVSHNSGSLGPGTNNYNAFKGAGFGEK